MIAHFPKESISKEMLDAVTFVGEYPSRVKFGLQALRGKDVR